MSNQYLKLRRSAVPGKVPDTASLDFGEIALNTHDGLAFMKISSSVGQEVIAIGGGAGDISGSTYYAAIFSGSSAVTTGSIYDSGSFTGIGAIATTHPEAPERLFVDASDTESYNLISGHGSINNYLQLNVKNFSSGISASSDIVATADNGDETSFFIDMGINSDGYNIPDGVGQANDAYLYSTGQDLLIGNASAGKRVIIFNGSGPALDNARIYINSQGTVGVNANNPNITNPEALLVEPLTTGSSNPAADFANLIVGRGTINESYMQLNINNLGTGSYASSDIVASNDASTETTNYVDMGINASTKIFDPSFGPGGPNDTYLLSTGNDLLIGSATSGDVVLWTGPDFDNKVNAKLILKPNDSHIMTGSLETTQGFTGSLFGTASWAQNFLTSSVTSASYAATASSADNFVVRNSLTASNALINGTITAQTLVVQTVTSSIVYSSGSNNFGSQLIDQQTFTGSVNITGSLNINGNTAITSDVTASMSVASASFAPNFYNSNGILSGNRLVTIDDKQLVYRSSGSTLQNYTFTLGTPTGVTPSTWPSSVIYEGEYLMNANSPEPFNTRVWGRNQSSANRSFWVNQTFADITAESTGATSIINQLAVTRRGSVLDTSTTAVPFMRGVNSELGHTYAGAATTLASIVTTNQQAFNSTVSNLTGTVTNSYNYFARNQIGYNGSPFTTNITNLYGFYLETLMFAGASSVTNYYGLFLNTPSITAGTIANRWGVYAPDSSMKHYINGNLSLGTVETGSYKLLVVGSSNLNGRVDVTGSLNAPEITGSLFGTASWAQNSITASYALNISGAIENAVSASYAFTASSAISASQAQTASYVLNTISSSYSFTASSAVNSFIAISSSNAATASSADNFIVRQALTASSALITGTITAQTLVVSTVSSSVVYSSGSNIFGNSLTNTQVFTGSVSVTGSLSVNGSNVVLSNQTGSMSVATASFAQTASYALATAAVFPFTGSARITGSLNVTGSTSISGSLTAEVVTSTQYTYTNFDGNDGLYSDKQQIFRNYFGNTFGRIQFTGISAFGTATVGLILAGWNVNTNALHIIRDQDAGNNYIYIGSTTTNAHKSASFHVDTPGKGVLLPRMGTAQYTNMSAPPQGLFLYDTGSSAEGFYYFSSGSIKSWTRLLNNTGSQVISGSLTTTQGFTGSLFGTASWAQNSITASYALNVSGTIANAVSASYAFTASSAISSSFSITTLTASYANSGFDLGIAEFQTTSSITVAGTTIVSSINTGSFTSAFYNYTIASGSNARSGQIMSVWQGSTITYTEVTTTDIGNTATASFAATLSGPTVRLSFTAPGVWTVKSIANLL